MLFSIREAFNFSLFFFKTCDHIAGQQLIYVIIFTDLIDFLLSRRWNVEEYGLARIIRFIANFFFFLSLLLFIDISSTFKPWLACG